MAATQARRKEYLDGLANEALAQEDDDDARRKALEDAQEAAEQKRRDNIAKREAARTAWLESVEQMQEAAKQFVAALEHGLKSADAERAAGAVGIGFSDVARMVRVSKYLSGELRRVLGPSRGRFGELMLASFPPRPIADWKKEEMKK